MEGVASVAFHPDYQSNGRFYVSYTNTAHESLLVEYQVSSDPDLADPGSAKVILGPVPQPHVVHNWNQVVFGPDGMLYMGCGDGGPDNDPNAHGQDLSVIFGKILRLDVDLPAPHVPPDNPFVGVPGVREEIWAYGVREPWKLHFDRATGDLYIADVGQAQREEIDFQPASSTGGENYGWRCMEGNNCTGLSNCACAAPGWIAPIHEYTHADGCAIIGGTVYRGPSIPWLQGHYLFAEFCLGRVWSLRYDGATVHDFVERTAELVPCAGPSLELPSAWGEDALGELYVVDRLGGQLFRIADAGDSTTRYCGTSPNSVGPGARIDHTGSTSVSANAFTLLADGLPANQFGIFYYGRNRVSVPFGDGVRCAGGTTFRLLPALAIGATGAVQRPVDFTVAPQPGGQGLILPGSTWHFQFWYRDPMAGGAGFNFSDALSAYFCP
jgi:hypothetical protein